MYRKLKTDTLMRRLEAFSSFCSGWFKDKQMVHDQHPIHKRKWYIYNIFQIDDKIKRYTTFQHNLLISIICKQFPPFFWPRIPPWLNLTTSNSQVTVHHILSVRTWRQKHNVWPSTEFGALCIIHSKSPARKNKQELQTYKGSHYQ